MQTNTHIHTQSNIHKEIERQKNEREWRGTRGRAHTQWHKKSFTEQSLDQIDTATKDTNNTKTTRNKTRALMIPGSAPHAAALTPARPHLHRHHAITFSQPITLTVNIDTFLSETITTQRHMNGGNPHVY